MPVKKTTEKPAKKQAAPSEEPAVKPAKAGKFVVPKSHGVCADLLMDLKAQKAAKKKELDDIDEKISAVQNYLIDTLPKSSATGAVGKVAKALIKVTQEPTVEDWEAFYAHISKTKSWDLMQRRLSGPAVKERWEAKKQVPGVVATPIVKVSVTKI